MIKENVNFIDFYNKAINAGYEFHTEERGEYNYEIYITGKSISYDGRYDSFKLIPYNLAENCTLNFRDGGYIHVTFPNSNNEVHLLMRKAATENDFNSLF